MDYGYNQLKKLLEYFENMSVSEYINLYNSTPPTKYRILVDDYEVNIEFSKQSYKDDFSYLDTPINENKITYSGNKTLSLNSLPEAA